MGPIIYVFSSLMKANLYILTFISFFYFSNSNIGISGSNVWSICITFLCWKLCQDLLEPKYGILQIFRILLHISRFFCPTCSYFIVYLYLSQIFRWECDFKILRGLNFFFTLEFGISTIFGFFQKSMLSKTSARKERRNKISICLRLYILLAATFKCANRNEINKACQNYKNTST